MIVDHIHQLWGLETNNISNIGLMCTIALLTTLVGTTCALEQKKIFEIIPCHVMEYYATSCA